MPRVGCREKDAGRKMSRERYRRVRCRECDIESLMPIERYIGESAMPRVQCRECDAERTLYRRECDAESVVPRKLHTGESAVTAFKTFAFEYFDLRHLNKGGN